MKEVKKLQKLKEYLKGLKKQEIESIYEKIRIEEDEVNSYEEKLEMIYSQLLFNASSIMMLNIEQFKVIKDIATGVKVDGVDDFLIDNYMIIKRNNGYETFEEIVDIYEQSSSREGDASRKQLFIGAYLEYNGVLEVDKLIELMKESGFEVTKRELNSILKNCDYKKVGNLVYLNGSAENLNIDNILIHIKNDCEFGYKVLDNFQEVLMNQLTIHDFVISLDEIFKKKIKNNEVRNEIIMLIMYRVIAGGDYQSDIEELFEFKNIVLSKKMKDELYYLIDDVYYVLPCWVLNGYSPVEVNSEIDSYEVESYMDDGYDFGFDTLSTSEKLEVYVNAYMQINGAIKLNKLVEIITVNHQLEVSKDDIVSNINSSDNIKILNDYVTLTEVNDKDLQYLLNVKKIEQYYIIDDIDNHFDNVEELEEKINDVICHYKLGQDVLDSVMSIMNIGFFNEEMLNLILEENGVSLLNKKIHQLCNDLKPYVNKYPVWYLNGFSLYEVNQKKNVTKKVGRNEPCPCGSEKKYKQCCGK